MGPVKCTVVETAGGRSRTEWVTSSFKADELMALSKQLGGLNRENLVNWLMEVDLLGDSQQYTIPDLVDLAHACMAYKDFAALPVKVQIRSIESEQEPREALFKLFYPGAPLEVLYFEVQWKVERPESYIQKKRLLLEAFDTIKKKACTKLW